MRRCFRLRRPPILRAERELPRAQRSSRWPSRGEVAPLFAAPASGDSTHRHILLPAFHRRISRAISESFSREQHLSAPRMLTPLAYAAGGALTEVEPPSDVPCRLAGTALLRLHTAGQLTHRWTSRIRLKVPVMEPAARLTDSARAAFHTRGEADAVDRPRTPVVVSRDSRTVGFPLPFVIDIRAFTGFVDSAPTPRTVSPYRHRPSRQRTNDFLPARPPSPAFGR